MKRRDFITLLGGAAAAWPMAARAQQPLPVIGFLGTESPDVWASRVSAFRQGLSETGYVEGQNVAIEFRWAEGHNDRLPALAADLVGRRVAVIATNGVGASIAKAATSTIPIVFQIAGDPVKLGLVASLNHPGGNLTGATGLGEELGPKKLQMLHELVPAARDAFIIVNPFNPGTKAYVNTMVAAVRTVGMQLHVLHASTSRDLEAAFASLVQTKADGRAIGLIIATDAFLNTQLKAIASLALRYAVPTIFQYREFVEAGGLLGYGGNVTMWSYWVGVYTGRILKGEKPQDLPVIQASKVELFLNLKTAKALGISVPVSILVRADEVIE